MKTSLKMRRWFVTPVENQMIRTIGLITNSGDLLSLFHTNECTVIF